MKTEYPGENGKNEKKKSFYFRDTKTENKVLDHIYQIW